MRVVEEKAVEAIMAGKGCTCSPNTVVIVKGGRCAVALHGHVIVEADVAGGNVSFPYEGQWMNSVTTKSRVRNIARGLGVPAPY